MKEIMKDADADADLKLHDLMLTLSYMIGTYRCQHRPQPRLSLHPFLSDYTRTMASTKLLARPDINEML